MKTTFVLILAILVVFPTALLSQESKPKRVRERPPQSQPKQRPAAQPQKPRTKERTKPSTTVPRRRPAPRKTDRVRDRKNQQPQPKDRPAAQPQKPRTKERTKPSTTVPRRRLTPRKTDEVRDRERQRPKPSLPRRKVDQPSPRVKPEVRSSPRKPVEKRPAATQELVPTEPGVRRLLRQEHRQIFESAESAISHSSIRSLSSQLAPKVYINISGGESGYFSANQAQYVLENYFGAHRPVTFSFSTFGESLLNPYATGRGSFVYQGRSRDVQVYVSLTQQGTRWVISQVNIY